MKIDEAISRLDWVTTPYHKVNEAMRVLIPEIERLRQLLIEVNCKYNFSVAILRQPNRIEYLFNKKKNCYGYWIDKQWCGGVLSEAIAVAAKKEQAAEAGKAGE